jgi:nucleotide-binding universal stress UspA family protein
MYKHILIPTDGSELSERAVREGIDLALMMKARVTLLTASAPFRGFASEPTVLAETPRQYEEDVERRANLRLRAGEEYADARGVVAMTRHVYAEHPFEAIVEAAEGSDCDLVCMASHGRTGLAGLLIGSQTAKVLSHSKIPVLVCR